MKDFQDPFKKLPGKHSSYNFQIIQSSNKENNDVRSKVYPIAFVVAIMSTASKRVTRKVNKQDSSTEVTEKDIHMKHEEQASFSLPLSTWITLWIVGVVIGCATGILGYTYLYGWETTPPVKRDYGEKARNRGFLMNGLRKWFEENGGYIHPNLEIRTMDEHGSDYGIFAKGPVKKDEVMIAVAPHLIIDAYASLHSLVADMSRLHRISSLPPGELTPRLLMESLGAKSELANETEDKFLDGHRQQIVAALFLMAHEDNMDNFYWPYLATLPTGCQNSVCWTEAQLREAFTPWTVAAILKGRQEYTTLANKLGLDLDDFLQKVSVIGSRVWQDGPKDAPDGFILEDIMTLVPIMDLLNHHKDGDSWNDFYGKAFKGCYLQNNDWDYDDGDQIWDTYGEKNSWQLYSHYGFVLPNNIHDDCDLLQRRFRDSFIEEKIGTKCPPRSFRQHILSRLPYSFNSSLYFGVLSTCCWFIAVYLLSLIDWVELTQDLGLGFIS
eukprot:g1275.t1